MTHVYDLTSLQLERPSMLTIGVFDGVHKGHQTLIRTLVAEAKKTNRLAVALTFFPHPDIVLRNLQGRYYLTSPEQRAELLLGLGIDYVITHPFNETIRQIRATDFVEQLLQYLNMKSLWVGEDFALGYKREGNVRFLREQGNEKGFEVQTIDLVTNSQGEEIISSSQIRELLLEGNVDQVRNWLGRGYTVRGKVIRGEQRGRTIGFPTANLAVWEEQVIPANGVYAGWARVQGKTYMAVTNIGIRPTFNGQEVRVEPHLLDFDKDIYEEELTLSFETRLRGEKKFNGIDELVQQIQQDADFGREYLSALKK